MADCERHEVPKEHGSCECCGFDFNGKGIWQHFYDEFTIGGGYWRDEEGNYVSERRLLTPSEAESAADEVSASYGANRTSGRFGNRIGISYFDRIQKWKCPNCGHTVDRTGSVVQQGVVPSDG